MYKLDKNIKATKIKTEAEASKQIKNSLSNSNYFFKATSNIITTDTPSIAYILGFYAMEHKAKAFIAKKGYKTKLHKTVIDSLIYLGHKDLAQMLEKAHIERLNHYRMNLDEGSYKQVK